ncbi:MAG: hypothetical protein ABI672_00245 [Vicinamibacteria bacterium]
MRYLRLLAVSFFMLLSIGCFQGQRAFKVNADGSGTIVDTTKLGEQAQGMLKGFADMETTTAAEKKAKQTGKYTSKAAAMGEDVTFVSVETEKDGTNVATYAFKDITKVRAPNMPSADANSTSEDEPTTFRLSKNAAGNAVLTVVTPKEKAADPSANAPKETPEAIQQQVMMVKRMMAGLKVKSVVEVNGSVIKTNGAAAVGNTVTLMELDFDALDEAA